MHRTKAIIGLVVVALAATTAVAVAFTPQSGGWIAEKGSFTVNSAGTRVTDFTTGKCYMSAINSAKIKSNGKFSRRGKISVTGGKPQKVRMKGRFTSATSAKVFARSGKCKTKFKIGPESTPEPEPTAEPEPTEEPEEEIVEEEIVDEEY